MSNPKISLIFPYREMHNRKALKEYVSKYYIGMLDPYEVIYADDPDPTSFNRGRALNVGVERSSGDILIFADNDLLIAKWAMEKALERVKEEEQDGLLIPFTSVSYITYDFTNLILRGQKKIDPNLDATQHIDSGLFKGDAIERVWPQLSSGGTNLISRSSFYKAYRFEDRLRNWGIDDAILYNCIETFTTTKTEWISSGAMHLWHPSNVNIGSEDYQKNIALCKRYEEVFLNKEKMLEIIKERGK